MSTFQGYGDDKYYNRPHIFSGCLQVAPQNGTLPADFTSLHRDLGGAGVTRLYSPALNI